MSAPLKDAQLFSLMLATAFCILGMSVGIDALVKSMRQKNKLRHSTAAGVSVSIDTSDIFNSGVVNTVICALLTTLISASARRQGLHLV
ncbi:hypothetical protein SCP_1800840 [Sparassis crispa]|uniref:Uncharacterized protein n=1 Tax=Sparassis crispa TaxID=139825 RepID=A0A401H6M8_9APHY|nr:hypothetical protein SCP_1800840 [Sparassis crispa]GBE90062.1 hypothetical protein SCP_1800840 [Sparassis crispa]